MPQTIWTISNKHDSPAVGNDLTGLHIQQTATGFSLLPPNLTQPALSTSNASAPPFDFKDFTWDSLTWDMHVASLGAAGGGTWRTPAKHGKEQVPPQSGDFTAQTGGAMDADAASSAGYGTR